MSPRAMTRYTFEVVKHHATKRVDCDHCGKRLVRSQTFEATINPWNVNDDGTPRSREQIRARLREKADLWTVEPVTCTPCLRAQR